MKTIATCKSFIKWTQASQCLCANLCLHQHQHHPVANIWRASMTWYSEHQQRGGGQMSGCLELWCSSVVYKALPLGDTRKGRQKFLDPVYMERRLSRVKGSPPRLAYKSCSNFSTSASSLRCSRPTHSSERLERLRRRQSASGKFMFSAAKARESWGQLTGHEKQRTSRSLSYPSYPGRANFSYLISLQNMANRLHHKQTVGLAGRATLLSW